jgi:hypothetical protein
MTPHGLTIEESKIMSLQSYDSLTIKQKLFDQSELRASRRKGRTNQYSN